MLPSCREVAELASENLDNPIKGTRWLKFKLHLLMCTYCRRYVKQMGIAKNTVCHLGDHGDSENSRAKIFEKVEANFKDTHKAE